MRESRKRSKVLACVEKLIAKDGIAMRRDILAQCPFCEAEYLSLLRSAGF